MGLRVLIAVHALAARGGVQSYVFDLARGLLALGHEPVVYSPVLGEVASDFREATVPVVDDLARVGARPDVINGHCGVPASMTAALHFPGVPAVFALHGWDSEVPPTPRFTRLVAVDRTCRDRLVLELGVPEERVSLIPNTVDLARFAPRPPLPARPARALVFGTMGVPGAKLDVVKGALEASSVALDVVGWLGATHPRPETVLGAYDLVFAKARCALEAMAVGCAVVLCDYGRLGPLVTSAEVARLRELNFGVRAIAEPLTHEGVLARVRAYDAADAALVTAHVRRTAGHEAAVHAWLETYEQAIEDHRRAPPDPLAESRATAAYVQSLAVKASAWDGLGTAVQRLARRIRAAGDRARRYRLGAWIVNRFRVRRRSHWCI